MERIVKENYYLDIAETVLERSTCLRRQYGAIIVRNDEIVATGYNGAPRGRKTAPTSATACASRCACRAASGMSCAAASMPRRTRSSPPPATSASEGTFISSATTRRQGDLVRRDLLLDVQAHDH